MARREAERVMSASPSAPWLYEVRRRQCQVSAARALKDGAVPTAELWVPWLRACSGNERDESDGKESDGKEAFTRWRDVEESLVDSGFALDESQEADEIRRRLLPLPEEERRELIRDENGESCDYLVACACLAAEERHRDVGDLAAAWTAVWIADARQTLSAVPHPTRASTSERGRFGVRRIGFEAVQPNDDA